MLKSNQTGGNEVSAQNKSGFTPNKEWKRNGKIFLDMKGNIKHQH